MFEVYLQLVGIVPSTRGNAVLICPVYGEATHLINTWLQPRARAHPLQQSRLNDFIRICRYTALKRGVNAKVNQAFSAQRAGTIRELIEIARARIGFSYFRTWSIISTENA
jgi:hypothetical protein